MRYVLLIAALMLAAFAAFLAFGPSPIDPVAWAPPANPGLTGPFAANEALKAAGLMKVSPGAGPEDVALGPDGFLYSGLESGDIVRLGADGAQPPEIFARTGGRPLGMEFAADGALIVADARRGLLRVAPDGSVSVLSAEAEGVPIAFADDVAIANDGTIYFSDASMRGYEGVGRDAWEGRPQGRLLAYDPRSGATRVLLKDLRFANGVTLGPEDAFVLVNETFGYRVTRYWLSGPKAGAHDVFFDGLPGFPDNLSFDGQGTVWIALVSPRDDTLDGLAGRPLLRRMLFGFFSLVGFPDGGRYGWVIGVGLDGRVTRNLQDPSGHVHDVTSVNFLDGRLVLGSLRMDAIAVLPAP